MSPEQLARRFHEHYEFLAPTFGYETRKESAVAWEDVPQKNRDLMIAVAAMVLVDLDKEKNSASPSNSPHEAGE